MFKKFKDFGEGIGDMEMLEEFSTERRLGLICFGLLYEHEVMLSWFSGKIMLNGSICISSD
jgi:hypothetical protein